MHARSSSAPSDPGPGVSGPTWREVAQSRKRPRRLLSLRGRLLLYFTVVVSGSLGATAWVLTERSIEEGRRTLGDVAHTLGTTIAGAAAPALATQDAAALATLLQEATTNGQLLSVAIIDQSGKRIVEATSDSSKSRATAGLAASHPIIAHGNGKATLLGHVELRVDDRLLTRGRTATLQAVGFVAAGLILSAILLSWLFLRSAMRPLKRLIVSAKRVSAGDLDARIDIEGDDVAGDLAAAFNDLTARIREGRSQLEVANRATADAIADLEKKVEHRTAQLEAANGLLSGEIAEKEDFLRAVSHDLNAPLRNIGGMVTMLMRKNKDQLPADAVARLERIQKNVEVETDLINELLELSRIKTRRQTLEVVDVESLVWDLRGVFENDLKTRHIDVVLETSLPTLYAERTRVRQVFQNLIDNAIKYMGDGPRREIRVGCRVSVTEAEFYVSDTGMGIHPEDVDKVFFVFRRGRGEVASKVPGKGVGLSSVKSIVETYAGRIWVQSTLGEGTTFRFTINGKYVPSVAGGMPSEMAGQAVATGPTLATSAHGKGNRAA